MNTNRSTKPPHWLRSCLLLLYSTFIIQHSSFGAESPLYIPFQGQVTNQAGAIAADGQYSVIFNLYDQAVGGQPVWSERHVKIGVTRGMINVFLGSITPLTGVDFSQTKYLGITVDIDNLATTADPEMVPRSLIIPSFHAKKAENATKLAGYDWSSILVGGSNDPSNGEVLAAKIQANGLTAGQLATDSVGADEIASQAVTTDEIADGTVTEADLDGALNQRLELGLIPAGTIVPFAGSIATIPPGWELCDGRAIDKDAESSKYQRLFDVIGSTWGNGTTGSGAVAGETEFNLPDLRGMFLRGVSGDSLNDPDKTTRTAIAAGGATGNIAGSVQVDTFQGHRHQYYAANGFVTRVDGGINMTWISGSADNSTASNGSNGAPRYSNETRPKNAYVNYIIKL